MDASDIWLNRFRRACTGLHDSKQKTRKEALESVSTLIENPEVIGSLHSQEWQHAFTSVKAVLYKEMGKLEGEIRKKGREGSRSSAFPCECRDLLNAIAKTANQKRGVINFNDYYQYLKETNPIIKKYCLEYALDIFRNYFILKDSYWEHLDLEDIMGMKEFFKKLHENEPNTKALQCYNALIQKGSDYRLSMAIIHNELDFIQSVIFNIHSSNLSWLLEAAAEVFLIFCQTCGESYKQTCIVEGEKILFHLLKFYNPHGHQFGFKTTLMEIIALELQYHQDCQAIMTQHWHEVLACIGSFIKTSLDLNDTLVMSHTSEGIQFVSIFKQIVVGCFKQSYDSKLTMIDIREPLLKRHCKEESFYDIFQNIDSHMEPKWILLFSMTVENHPDIISKEYFTRLLTHFSNLVKDCKSMILRDSIFKCIFALIAVEKNLCKNDKELLVKTNEWLSIYDSAVRVISVNQNLSASHMLLHELLTTKNQLLSPGDCIKLWNLYASQTIKMNEMSLQTLHIYNSFAGLRENSIENKNKLIDFILQRGIERKSCEHFSHSITAVVLVNLTFKYYTNNVLENSTHAQPLATVINKECYQYFVNAITFIANDVQNRNSQDYEIHLRYIYLCGRIIYLYQQYDMISNAHEIKEITLRLMKCTWQKIKSLFGSFANVNSKVLIGILNLLMEVFKFDEKLGIINSSIDLDFIQALVDAQCELETDSLNYDDVKVKLKMTIVEIFTVFALKGDTETQSMVQLMLYEFEDFDPFDEVDYHQAMIIFRGLHNQNGRIKVDGVTAILTLLQRICKSRIHEYHVCVDVLHVLRSVLCHLIHMDNLPGNIKDSYLGIFKTLHHMRHNFGYKVELALVQCLDSFLKAATLTWAKYNEELLVLLLPTYLESDHLQVQSQTIHTIGVLFGHASCCIQGNKLRTNIFLDILRKLDVFQMEISRVQSANANDVLNNRSEIVLQLFLTIILMAKSSKFAKMALGEIFVRSRMYKISNDRLYSTLKEKRIDINIHLNTVLQCWCRKYPISDFPYELFQYDTKKVFFLKNLPEVTLIALSNDEGTLHYICNEIGKSPVDVLKEAYFKYIAITLIERATNNSNIIFNDLTHMKYNEVMSNSSDKNLMALYIDDILVEILKYVHDLAHFQNMFANNMCIDIPDDIEIVISHDQFCNNVMKLLEEKLSCDVVHYLLSKPHKLQQLLLKLKCNISWKVNPTDKMFEFYHYGIFVKYLLEKHTNDTYVNFILKEVIYTIINMVKHETENIQNFALTFLAIVVDLSLCKFSKQFSEFIIVICSSLLPHAAINNSHAIYILEKIVFSEDTCIKSNLKYLDPFPEGNEHLREIRSTHMRYRVENIALADEIKLFLVGKQYKDSRTEGLKHLRDQLKHNVEGLKNIYLELNEMGGILSKESVLHLLIIMLVELVKSKDNNESMEALKCLGILGASDLTTMVLLSHNVIETKESSSHLFIAKMLELLNTYLIDWDVKVVKSASEAVYAILSTEEGRSMLATERGSCMRPFLVPFISKGARNEISLLSVTNELTANTLNDNDLWCPEQLGHDEWIKSLVTHLFQGFTHPMMKCFLPIVAIKAAFAEECFSLIVNLLLDTSLQVKILTGERLHSFFEKHFNQNITQMCDSNSPVMNISSIKCMLNAIHFVRLHRSFDKRGKPQELDLSINYLHLAKAAIYCSAHFSALMYSEKWYHSTLNSSNFTSTYHELSPFSLLEEIGHETSQLRSVLTQAYKGIGDSSALFGGHLQDLLDLNEPTCRTSEHNLDFQLLCSDIQLETNGGGSQYLINMLKDNALYNLAVITAKEQTEYGDAYNECMWRLSKWELPKNDQNSTAFEFHVYNLLSAFNDGDKIVFDMWLNKSRLQVAQTLKKISLESCKTLYSPLSQLERLQELEDIFYATQSNGDLKKLVEDLRIRDEIRSEYQYWEPRLAQRIEAIKLLRKRNVAGAQEFYANLTLNYADMALEHGNLKLSKRVLCNFYHLSDRHINARVALLNAQIYWKLGHSSSISKLKKLLHNYDCQTRLRSTILKICGDWMVEHKAEFPQTILEEYFVPGLNILSNLESQNGQYSEADSLNALYKTLARFADEEYQQSCKSINSVEFERKVESMNKMKECVKKLNAVSEKSYDIRKAIITYQRMTKIDEMDIIQKKTEKDMFLNVAIKYYLHHLKYSTEGQSAVFRIFSLWFENNRNDAIIRVIEEDLLQLQSYKILPLLPQLVPHISRTDDIDPYKNRFSKCINNLIEKCGKEHPHHAIPLILCVANTNQDDNYTKENAKTSSNESRIAGAQLLINKLKHIVEYRKIVEENEQIAAAFTELAYYKQEKGLEVFKFPRNYKINKIQGLTEAMMPTYVLPYQPSLNYERIVSIHKLKPHFTAVGGVNAPKRLECIGTDGNTRYLLIKGQDDLRQDAVMQQVFGIMNDLLRANKDTLNFKIRTYKVVPLSKRSGVLEWVNNTQPLGQYLANAHAHYYPNDMSLTQARQQIKGAAGRMPLERLKVYLTVCERIRPVFHKYFETTFLEPTSWYEKRRAYTQSVATSSMCGYILGIGDRHVQNILIDNTTAEVVHIDFGIAFEQGRILPTPETVPFRLTRDIVDGMGICGVEGTFRKTCEKTMEALHRNASTIQTILEVLLYDPLYDWSISPTQAYSRQMDEESHDDSEYFSAQDTSKINVAAQRALVRIKHKLIDFESTSNTTLETQVNRLIRQAREPSNLSRLYFGWQAYL